MEHSYPPALNLQKQLGIIKALSVTNKKEALEKLYAPFKQCMRCPLATQGRSQVVFGEGDASAQLVFVGEGPGRDEDTQGRPFVGRAGHLLNKIIEAMGFKRSEVYITNVVKCRPPANRTPLPDEMGTCSSLILFKELAIIKPTVICALGASATQTLLTLDVRMGAVRGRLHAYEDYRVMPTYHPAYLLRNPDAKRVVWEDMKQIMVLLGKKLPA